MTEIDIQNLSEIKSLIEENNAVLKAAIQAIEILTLQHPDQQSTPQPAPMPARNYPGYTTPPYFGFMQ